MTKYLLIDYKAKIARKIHSNFNVVFERSQKF